MPRRDPELPEGTDQIVSGAAASDGNEGGGGGFVAKSDGANSASDATERLVHQVKEQVTTLRGRAGDQLRGYADDGKARATTLLDDISGVIEDAARSIDSRLGDDYGDYAHRAATAVSSFAGKVRDKSVDDLLDDTRDIVRKSPAVAIAAAAVVGFALMRVVRTGLDEVGATRGRSAAGGGTRRKGGKAGTSADDGA